MLNKKSFILSLITTLVLIIVILVFLNESSYYLIVKVNGKEIFVKEIDKPIYIRYIFMHSSERTPWIEYWAIKLNGIYVKKICWTSGGAGHPSNIQDFNNYTIIIEYKNYYCALNVNRFLGKHVIIDLGHAYNASLIIENKTIRCQHGVHYIVELVVRKINVLESFLINLSLSISSYTSRSYMAPHNTWGVVY